MIEDRSGRKQPANRALFSTGNLSEIVVLTVCTKDRKTLLANAPAHDLLVSVWQGSDHWQVGRYVIMPDHLHLFCTPARTSSVSVKAWMKYWKSQFTKQWPNQSDRPIWQSDGWDTQLRRGESYDSKWAYVRENPVRAGLVEKAEQWPYQGELNHLPWHDA